jgi:hypothetical protein
MPQQFVASLLVFRVDTGLFLFMANGSLDGIAWLDGRIALVGVKVYTILSIQVLVFLGDGFVIVFIFDEQSAHDARRLCSQANRGWSCGPGGT